MKKLLTLLFFCSVAAVVFSQGSWIQKADFGGTARQNAVGFSIGNKGYIGTGYDGVVRKDFWEYDPIGNVWTQKADFGGTARHSGIGFSIGQKGYIGTGIEITTNNQLRDFWEYNPSINVWAQKADFGGVARWRAVGLSIEGKGYIGLGGDAPPHYDFWEYDTASNSWSPKANFIGVGREDAVAFSIGNKGYIGTGYGGGLYHNDFWEYNPSLNSWTQKANVGGPTRQRAVAFSIGLKGYIGTGFNGNVHKDFWEYDPSLNTWVQKDDLDGAERHAAVGFSIGNKGYIGTGVGGAKELWQFNPFDISFTASNDSICFGDTVTFTNTTNDPDAKYYDWWFIYPSGIDTVYVYDTLSSTLLHAFDSISGAYSVQMQVYDTNNMLVGSYTMPIYVSKYNSISVIAKPDTCTGAVGSATAVVTGGTSPFNYLWSNANTNQMATGLSPGSYTVTVTDMLGCTITDSSVVGVFTNTVTISFSSIATTCLNADGSITANPSGGTTPYAYNWSGGNSGQTVNNLLAGNYTVNVTDKNGCTTINSSAVGTSTVAPTPAICMVTVDSLSQYNVIAWDKTSFSHVDSFIIYREINTNDYRPIGAVPYDSLSLFIDTVQTKYFPNTGDPNAGTYRYKIQMRDSCGNYSQLSPYHNTIYIINSSGTFSWPQLYTIEGSSNPVSTYELKRDDLSNGNWNSINSVSGTQQTVTDPAYSTWQATASWRVETMWGISCSPTRIMPQASAFNSSRSNIFTSVVTGVNEHYNNSTVVIYPNPTTGRFTVYSLRSDANSMEIYDLFGKIVFKTTVNNRLQTVNPALSGGMYFYKVFADDKIISFGKLVVE